MTSKP
jgi:hypothetical protein